ncbi:MAG TPA: TolC family protein, partial [Gemmataceae bacterium]|nr:TolC family protein [Gemmataceae bacterium]
RREDLYLAALPVTLERFAFAAQWFATEEAIRERFGREAPGGPTNRWVFNSNVGFNKLFPTGALLLFQLANRTVINLTGDLKHTISESTLLLDLVQPLLRGGGKAVTLEALTQAERNLLYEIRSYARFREQFYVFIAAGGDLGRAAGQVAGRAALALTPGVIAPTQGYLPILQISAQLANERRNVAALERLLEMFRAFREGELVTQLQVDQVEQQLLNSRNNVLNTELNYRDSLDRFKLQLGLPPGVDIELEASTLQPLVRQFSRYDVVVRQFAGAAGELERLRAEAIGAELQEESVGRLSGLLAAPVTLPVPAGLGTAAATTSAARLGAEPPEALLPPFPLRARVEQILTASPLVQGTQIRTRISERWVEWRKLTDKEVFERVNLLKEVRRKLELLRDKLSIEGKEFPEKDRQRLEEVYFEIDLGEMEDALRDYLTRPWRKIPDPVVRVSAQADLLQRVVRSAFSMLSRARRERLDAITESWPELPALRVGGVDLLQVDLAEAQAVVAQTALTNRFDLMNARAQLVDAWRQIAIAANALMGVFNVRYHWEAFSPFGEAKPLAIGGSRQQHQLFFNAELPLVRKSERNVYRAALISYQRQRREVMAAEDAVLVAVREEIRQLRVLAENYRIQKRLVELAYLQVENAEDTFRAPPEPVAQQRITGAATAAALTQQLLNAQASLLRAQNQTYQIWINYLTTRLFLYRDLELMPLDPRGVWIDESANLPRDAGPNGCPSAIQQPAPPGSSADERGDQLPAPRSLPSPPGGDGPP